MSATFSGYDLQLRGRYSLANRHDTLGNRREFACRTSRVSPVKMMIDVPVTGAIGERVISHFGEFGKLDGWIAEAFKGGFLFELALPRAKREALANKIVWLDREQRNMVVDAREVSRIIPKTPHSRLILPDGSVLDCLVIDMSPSGAAVSADTQPDIGTPLAVGCAVGRVVRHFTEGFAVKFMATQDRERLEWLTPDRLKNPNVFT